MKQFFIASLLLSLLWAQAANASTLSAESKACVENPSEACVLKLILHAGKEEADPIARPSVYARLAGVYGKVGRRTESDEYFLTAKKLALDIDNHIERDEALSAVVGWSNDYHDPSAVIRLLEQIGASDLKGQTLETLVQSFAYEQHFGAAEAALKTEVPDKLLARAYAVLIRGLADANLVDKALDTLDAFLEILQNVPPNSKYTGQGWPVMVPVDAFSLGHVAAAQVRAGNLEGAIKTAQRQQSDRATPSAMTRVAAARAEMGNLQGALETLREIEVQLRNTGYNPSYISNQRDATLLLIVRALITRQEFSRAIEIAKRIQDGSEYDSALSYIAREQARHVGAETALKTFSLFRQRKELSFADRLSIVEPLADAGMHDEADTHLDKALATTSVDDDIFWFARSRSFVAVHRYNINDSKGALQIFEDTLKIAKEKRAGVYVFVAQEVSLGQAAIGQIGEALSTALTIEQPQMRALSLSRLLEILLEPSKVRTP